MPFAAVREAVRYVPDRLIEGVYSDDNRTFITDLLGLHPGTARQWSKLAKGDWTAYIGDRTAEQFPPD